MADEIKHSNTAWIYEQFLRQGGDPQVVKDAINRQIEVDRINDRYNHPTKYKGSDYIYGENNNNFYKANARDDILKIYGDGEVTQVAARVCAYTEYYREMKDRGVKTVPPVDLDQVKVNGIPFPERMQHFINDFNNGMFWEASQLMEYASACMGQFDFALNEVDFAQVSELAYRRENENRPVVGFQHYTDFGNEKRAEDYEPRAFGQPADFVLDKKRLYVDIGHNNRLCVAINSQQYIEMDNMTIPRVLQFVEQRRTLLGNIKGYNKVVPPTNETLIDTGIEVDGNQLHLLESVYKLDNVESPITDYGNEVENELADELASARDRYTREMIAFAETRGLNLKDLAGMEYQELLLKDIWSVSPNICKKLCNLIGVDVRTISQTAAVDFTEPVKQPQRTESVSLNRAVDDKGVQVEQNGSEYHYVRSDRTPHPAPQSEPVTETPKQETEPPTISEAQKQQIFQEQLSAMGLDKEKLSQLLSMLDDKQPEQPSGSLKDTFNIVNGKTSEPQKTKEESL